MFISFEGIDCCGKTTQVKLLTEQLTEKSIDYLLLREPGGTIISEEIRTILLDAKNKNMTQITELLLFSASRAQLVSEVIKPALLKNSLVLCDRYVDSTTVYQGYGRGLTLGAVKTINRVATFDVKPDKTFFLDITVKEMESRQALSNVKKDRMELNNDEFYSRVREGYLEVANEEPERFVVIDGKQSIETIREIIWKEVEGMLPIKY